MPLPTNERGTFFRRLLALPGEAIEVSSVAVHWAKNVGTTDRIHLIFEYYDPDQLGPAWLATLK